MSDKKKQGESLFGGLFDGIDKLIDIASELKNLEKEGGKSGEGEIDLSHIKEGMKGVYGFSIKTAMGGKTTVEPFGNIKKTPKGPKVDEEREPITDVFDENDEILIVAEMPGVSEKDIAIRVKDDIVEIVATNPNRKYRKELLLESKVSESDIKTSFQNGIYNITLKKLK